MEEDLELWEGEKGHDHAAAVEKVRSQLPDDDILYDLADLFRIFADSSRIKILYALYESELCVGAITQALGMTQSAVSHQLRVLRAGRIVKFRKDGKQVYYSIDDHHIAEIIQTTISHLRESD